MHQAFFGESSRAKFKTFIFKSKNAHVPRFQEIMSIPSLLTGNRIPIFVLSLFFKIFNFWMCMVLEEYNFGFFYIILLLIFFWKLKLDYESLIFCQGHNNGIKDWLTWKMLIWKYFWKRIAARVTERSEAWQMFNLISSLNVLIKHAFICLRIGAIMSLIGSFNV